MKKAFQNLFLLTLALLLALGAVACRPVSLQPQASATATPGTAVSGLDLWTVPPEENPPKGDDSPSSVPVQTPAPEQTASPTSRPTDTPTPGPTESPVQEDGIYDSRDEVALYLHLFGHLPSNYITKKNAQSLGWSGGSLEPYAPGKCIGGDYFGNYEKLLPTKKGRTYYECDIDTLGARSRGSKRIVWSSDGLIYYTGDHYESYTLLYGEE